MKLEINLNALVINNFKCCLISGRRARVLVALAWTLSVIFSLPIVLLYHEKSVQGTVLVKKKVVFC
jgi:hypothetical protein